MCDRSNAEDIVQEMLTYLETADYTIREEMVLKIAILSEKYALDYKWYLDVMLKLIRIAGDFVSEEVNNRWIGFCFQLKIILQLGLVSCHSSGHQSK